MYILLYYKVLLEMLEYLIFISFDVSFNGF